MTPEPGAARFPPLLAPSIVLLLLAAAVTVAVWQQPRTLYTLAACVGVVCVVLVGTALALRRRAPPNESPDPDDLRDPLGHAVRSGERDEIRDLLLRLGRWPFLLDRLPDTDRASLALQVEATGLSAEVIEWARDPEESLRTRRMGAIHLLGWLGVAGAEEQLVTLARGQWVAVAEAAAAALLRLDTESALAAVVGLIGDAPLPDSRVAALLEKAPPERLIPMLEPIAEDTNTRCRFWIAHLAGRMRRPALVPLLLRFTHDESLDVRANAAEALGLSGDPAVRTRLHELLGDPSWVVRAHAASALAGRGAAQSVEPLTDLLHRDEWWVRESAVRALEAAGSAAIPPLRRRLPDMEGDERRAAVDVLRLVEPDFESNGERAR